MFSYYDNISYVYEARFYKNWQDVYTKNVAYWMPSVCNKNVAYCKIIFSVMLQYATSCSPPPPFPQHTRVRIENQ
jgi:hypothetical protein